MPHAEGKQREQRGQDDELSKAVVVRDEQLKETILYL